MRVAKTEMDGAVSMKKHFPHQCLNMVSRSDVNAYFISFNFWHTISRYDLMRLQIVLEGFNNLNSAVLSFNFFFAIRLDGNYS